MESHGINGIPWNQWNSMESHGINGIPWNPMELMESHGINGMLESAVSALQNRLFDQ
ncbi:unnamed protein product, partial [Rotaria sp. Silwood1]